MNGTSTGQGTTGTQATGTMIVVALPTTGEPWITGAAVVKRDDNGSPVLIRTPDGTIHYRFTVL
jgi:hypothetical protein